LAALKELLDRGLGDELFWLDTALMPADPLTKDSGDDEVLQHLMENNKFLKNLTKAHQAPATHEGGEHHDGAADEHKEAAVDEDDELAIIMKNEEEDNRKRAEEEEPSLSNQLSRTRSQPVNSKSPYFVLFDSHSTACAGDVAFPVRIGSYYLNLQSRVDARCSTSSIGI
jgi:hypothetical protein